MASSRFTDEEVVSAFPEMLIEIPRLGVGAQKAVFRANDRDVDVALKIMLWSASREDEDVSSVVRERFDRELSGMAAAECPHVIRLLRGPEIRHIGSQHHFWYTEPFLHGGTLDDRIAEHPLSANEVEHIALCLLHAIDSMWNDGRLVHRDIKPANIGFTADGTVVLLDLGIALFADMSPLTESSMSGPGTARYAAPEQFIPRRLASIDFRTDLFQLGIVLVEALTGSHPFFELGTDYMERLTSFNLEQLTGVQLTEGLRRLIPRLLAAEPSGRFRRVDMAIAILEGR